MVKVEHQTERLVVMVTPSMRNALATLSTASGAPYAELVRRAIAAYIENQKGAKQ